MTPGRRQAARDGRLWKVSDPEAFCQRMNAPQVSPEKQILRLAAEGEILRSPMREILPVSGFSSEGENDRNNRITYAGENF